MSASRPNHLSSDLLAVLRAEFPDGAVVRTVANSAENRVASVVADGVWVETDKSRREGKGAHLVPAWMLQLAWDELQRRGRLSAETLRDAQVRRSSAVLALLAALPGVEVASQRPIMLELSGQRSASAGDRAVSARPTVPSTRPEIKPGQEEERLPHATTPGATTADPQESGASRIGLVGCVKSKQSIAAPARDLYTSALFRGRRRFVEASCDRWFVLSALHGLVDPDATIEPYDATLTTASQAERRAWSRQVLVALECQLGSLDGLSFEVHAGASYRDHGLVAGLKVRGASVQVPTAHLTQGQQLAFYAASVRTAAASVDADTVDELIQTLLDPANRQPAATFPRDRDVADRPGLYCWWPDDAGLRDLSDVLSEELRLPIYAGQAGATTAKAGIERSATLYSRIRGNHLRGTTRSSTFRRTLAALLVDSLALRPGDGGRLDPDGEEKLSNWMRQHLCVSIASLDDRGALARAEESVLQRLDPPLNLMGMSSSTVRTSLRVLRSRLSDGDR